jgi:TonB family protein
MKQLEIWTLSYLLNSSWQVPLLFAAGWLMTRKPSAGTAVEHRVWVTFLLLQSLLPALSLLPWEWLKTLPWWNANGSRSIEAQVSIAMGTGSAFGESHFLGNLLTSIVILYVTVTVWFAARFLWRSMTIFFLRREAMGAALTREAREYFVRCSRRFAITHVSVAASSRIAGPVTMGIRRKLVLLPVGMAENLPQEDLETIIAHELIHIYRQDFLKNLLYELLSLPVAYHPLLWFTRARITETREMICDEMAAEINGQKHYANSLLRLARLLVEGTPAVTPHTIGIFDANTFERRIMNLSRKQKELSSLRRIALMGASAILGLGISASAMAGAVHIDPAAAADNSGSKAPEPLSVSPHEMAAYILTKVNPVYPRAAKKARIQGTVVLSAEIDKEGNVENVRAISGPPELQQSAIDAVRQWKYKPYLVNGEPVELLTNINVIYSLGG